MKAKIKKTDGAGDYLGSYLTDSILCFLFTTVTFLLVNKIKMTACKETGVLYSGVVDFAIGLSNSVLNKIKMTACKETGV